MPSWIVAPLAATVIVLYLVVNPKLTQAAAQPGGGAARGLQMTIQVLMIVAALLGALVAVAWLGLLLFPGIFGGT
jgi:hypothetical protein